RAASFELRDVRPWVPIVARLGVETFAAVVDLPVIIADAGSLDALVRLLLGAITATPQDDPLQYADFTEWLRQFQSGVSSDSRSAITGDLPPLRLTADRLEPGVQERLATAVSETALEATLLLAWLITLDRLGLGEAASAVVHDLRGDAALADLVGPLDWPLPFQFRSA